MNQFEMRPDITEQESIERKLPGSLEENRVLSAKQAADLFSISIATFRRLHWAGTIPPPVRLSERRIGWRVRDLLAYLDKRGDAAE
jgi:predicted DNA-binding transcriptional regulator AlpA